jgi:hypothetical protein
MSVSASELEALGALIARALGEGGSPPVTGPAASINAAVIAALQENFRTEAAIEREVDRQIEALGASARGLDPDKLRSGLRDRIAKQKGFAL